jgi:hypothetical protein
MFERRRLKDMASWLVFGLFFAITLWGLVNHAPWRDEAQSWLLVRDLNLGGLINQMSYEGTPPLWHLILFPLAKLGLPYASELIVHYLFALALVFLLIFFSPLPKIIKFILPFSYLFLFEYTVIARNYNLTVLLLFIIALIYNYRFRRPILYASLIFLLAWTNVHSLAMAAVLSCIFLYEIIKEGRSELKYLWGVVIMELGIVSAILILIPKIDQYPGLGFSSWHIIARSLSTSLLPFFENPTIPSYLLYPLSVVWIPLLIFLLKKNQSKILFLLPIFWLEFIFLFRYPGSMRHHGLILVFFLFAWWIDLVFHEKKIVEAENIKYKITVYLLSICLALSTIYAGYFYLTSINKNFSGAKEMAQYIKNNHLDGEEIAAYPSYSGSALLPYLPGKEFYQVETLKKGTFLTWNNAFYSGDVTPFFNLKKYLKYYYSLPQNKVDSVLILTTLPEGSNQESEFIFKKTNPDLEFIYKNTKETIKQNEFFYLYRLHLR